MKHDLLVPGRDRLLVALSALALLVATASAATIYVDDDAPNDPAPGDPAFSDPLEDGSPDHPFDAIQQGIDAALAGDTVLVADGVYTGLGNKDLDFHGKPITVRSASGNPETCIIDCQGAGRGFYFHSGETAEAVLAGLTIRNGGVNYASPGGARGGGVAFTTSSSPTVMNCAISGNVVRAGGGAPSGDIFGGGVYCASSSPTLIHCAISGNTAVGDLWACGGGLCFMNRSRPTLTDCAITGNRASSTFPLPAYYLALAGR